MLQYNTTVYTLVAFSTQHQQTLQLYRLALSSTSGTVPLRRKLTNERKRLVSPTISQVSIKHERVHVYTQVMHCLHTRESKLTSVNLKNTWVLTNEHANTCKTNTQVLTNEHTSTHKSLSEAIACLGDVCDFLESKGYTREASSSHALLDSLASLHCSSQTRQTSITEYFLWLKVLCKNCIS